jgi:GTP cyclohydrolase II
MTLQSRSREIILRSPSPTTTTVERVATARLPTRTGHFAVAAYRSRTSSEEFVCLYKGTIDDGNPTLVRIHSQCLTGDVFGSAKCDCGDQLRSALSLIEQAGRGVLVYQLQEGRGIGITNKIRAYALQDRGLDTIEANVHLGLPVDSRDYKQCVEILLDLGLSKVLIVSNNPSKIRAIEEGGLEIIERVTLDFNPDPAAVPYLRTKKLRMGHLI